MKYLRDHSITHNKWINLETNSPQPDICTGVEILEYEKFEKIFLLKIIYC